MKGITFLIFSLKCILIEFLLCVVAYNVFLLKDNVSFCLNCNVNYAKFLSLFSSYSF